MMTTGTKVRGSYFGHQFSGTISDRRPHTMNNSIIYFVALDSEISVFGDLRTDISFATDLPNSSICEVEA